VAISAIAVACTGRDNASPVTPSSSSSLSANSSSSGDPAIGTSSHGGGSGSGHGGGSGSGGNSGSGSGGNSGSGSGGSGGGNSGSGNGGDDHHGPGHDGDNGAENEVEMTGTITTRTGVCPTLTFSIGTTTFTTNNATVFRDPCADIVSGAVVEVKGTRQTNGTVLATRVHVEDREDENENENEVELTGTIAGKTGSCPSLTFSIGTTMFTTDAQTLFGEACSALVNGDRVEVKGTRQANGTVLASRVHVED
jgi:hypothetical protein